MAYFAKLNENNIVTTIESIVNNVITDGDGVEQEQLGIDFLYSLHGNSGWYKQTSYSGNIRKNFAGVGFTYDATKDAFIPPQSYPSWILNETTCRWDAPVVRPDDGKEYTWDEATTAWVEVT
tara:strand:+ start:185 stop:550 length:366 start_codon:yes stop_codon:yes gene_type:complete